MEYHALSSREQLRDESRKRRRSISSLLPTGSCRGIRLDRLKSPGCYIHLAGANRLFPRPLMEGRQRWSLASLSAKDTAHSFRSRAIVSRRENRGNMRLGQQRNCREEVIHNLRSVGEEESEQLCQSGHRIEIFQHRL